MYGKIELNLSPCVVEEVRLSLAVSALAPPCFVDDGPYAFSSSGNSQRPMPLQGGWSSHKWSEPKSSEFRV